MSQPAEYRGTIYEQVASTSEKYNPAASSSRSSTSTTTVRKFPENPSRERGETRELLRRLQMENLKKLHMECIGRPMPAPIAAEVLRDLDADTPAVYYKYALTEACYAPRPSWRYVQAIVRRCKAQMIDPSELEY